MDDAENRTGNDRFEGYSVDLIKEIADLLEFKYTIKLVEDGVYGKRNERGEWNGMIRELIEGVSMKRNPNDGENFKFHFDNRKQTWLLPI